MKRAIFILMMNVCLTNIIYSQNIVDNDTLNNFKNKFDTCRQKYMGHELSNILNDLPMEIKYGSVNYIIRKMKDDDADSFYRSELNLYFFKEDYDNVQMNKIDHLFNLTRHMQDSLSSSLKNTPHKTFPPKGM